MCNERIRNTNMYNHNVLSLTLSFHASDLLFMHKVIFIISEIDLFMPSFSSFFYVINHHPLVSVQPTFLMIPDEIETLIAEC